MLPSTWLERTLRIEYTDASGRACSTSGVLADFYPLGPVFVVGGAKTLISWNRICLLELRRVLVEHRKRKKRQESELVRRWDARVSDFLEENRPLLEDPDLGVGAARRLYQETADLLVALSGEVEAKGDETADAGNQAAEAIRAPHLGARAVHQKELRHKRLEAEFKRLLAVHSRLKAFEAEARAAVDEA